VHETICEILVLFLTVAALLHPLTGAALVYLYPVTPRGGNLLLPKKNFIIKSSAAGGASATPLLIKN